ncbi:MAG: BTAD domain-containing putative transcriptional regulator [Candidatus Promineifilaceae bacterium]|nr:BTAD domain-containing putative transcriptional regulator [Candidatus Promineifilaceae bacterium]
MPGLQIQVFGKLRMRYGDGTIEFFPTRRSEELLSYLLLNQAVQLPRERLVEMLWPDQALSNGRASLSTALWRLRTVFNQLGVSADDYLQASRDWVRLLPREPLSLDMSDFEQLLDKAARANQLAEREKSLRQAVVLYSGAFCEGIYAEWCLLARERLERRYLRALGQLTVQRMEEGDFDEALSFGRQLLERDPLREEVHRALMLCYLNLGRYAQGVRQFQECARLLQAELQTLPMPETIALYQRIIEARMWATASPDGQSEEMSVELQRAFADFQAAAAALNALFERAEIESEAAPSVTPEPDRLPRRRPMPS